MSVELTNLNTELLARKSTSPSRESSDGVSEKLWASRDGSLITMPWLLAMAMEGRVFNAALAVPDTCNTGATSYNPVNPGIVLVAPVGIVMIPVHIDVCFEDAAGTDNYIIIGCDAGDLYTSGGAAISAANNIRTDSPYASAVIKRYASSGAITMVDPTATERILFSYVNAFADATTSPPMQVVWEPVAPPVLVGPATLFVYTYGSTAPKFSFSIQWVELPKEAIV